jgi:hypothetical protein
VIFRGGHNENGIGRPILNTFQGVVIKRTIGDILKPTVTSTAVIVDPVPSGITGRSPRHNDASETLLDCSDIGGWGDTLN